MKKAVLGSLILFSILLIAGLAVAQDNEGTIQVTIAETAENCNLNFRLGWNLFSFCSELQNANVVNTFSPINFRYVMKWNITTQEFEIYSPRAIIKPFDILDDNESYFLYAQEEENLLIPGDEAGAESRNLIAGWNTPSYPYRNVMSVETMLADIKPDIEYLMKWNNINQLFDIWSPKALINPFDYIGIGEGQFIYALKQNTLYYQK